MRRQLERVLARFQHSVPLSASVFLLVTERHLYTNVKCRVVVSYCYYVEKLSKRGGKVVSERAKISRHAAVLLGFRK